MAHIILNGALTQAENASISIHDRGFRFGDGIFETIAVHGGVPYRWDWHINRLSAGLSAIRIPYGTTSLAAQCRELLSANHVSEGLLRIQISRGCGSKGYLPDLKTPPTLLIETLSRPQLPAEPITLWVSSYRKPSPAALPVRYKLCQGLNSALARMEAADNGCFEALLLNEAGNICETSSGNIFWIKGDVLFTPALSCGLLEGSMRAAIMSLTNLRIEEVEAPLTALDRAEAIFICNVAWGLLEVSGINASLFRASSTHAAINAIRKALEADIKAYSLQHANFW